MKKKPSVTNRYYFLAGVIILQLILLYLNSEKAIISLRYTVSIILKIIPVLLIVLLLMTVVNFFLDKKRISRYIGEGSGFSGFLIAAFVGIISHGPIFAWYPMVRDLLDEGMNVEYAAVFLYTRAIKLPLLPLLIYYFGWKFVFVWFIFLIAGSYLLGKMIGFIMRWGVT